MSQTSSIVQVPEPSTSNAQLSHDDLLRELGNLARRAVARFDLPSSVDIKLINVSENATYKVEGGGRKWALRVHREGYHSPTAIRSELAWLKSLKETGSANVPTAIPGLDGDPIQTVAVPGLDKPRNVVLFAWESGVEPNPEDRSGYELLGETAARMHAHVKKWSRPPWFDRHAWTFETTLGDTPHWGRWRDGMGMTSAIEGAFAEAVGVIKRRLERLGQGQNAFNLVHGDMRLANLLVDGGTVKVIDFDDCGFSWYLYDCATTVSFFEERADVPDLVRAWVKGYRRIGKLSEEEEAEIETFIMLRRILLVAWIGSHSETDLAQSMGVKYTAETVPLCERYVSKFGAASSSAPKKGWFARLFG